MSTDLTDKTYCLVTHRTGRYYVNQKRRDALVAIVNSEAPPLMVEIDGNHVATIDIAGIVTADQLYELDRVKRGDWQCRFGYWHERNQSCAHNHMPKH